MMAYSTLAKLRHLQMAHPAGVIPQVFIETGTQHAVTAHLAQHLYPVIETIELSEALYSKAVALFKAAGVSAINGLRLHRGDSAKVLPEILARYAEPVCVYLDAHWYESPDVVGRDCFPLWLELAAIAARSYADTIVVDDFHSFGVGSPAADWFAVTQASIVAALNPARVLDTERVDDHFVVYRSAA
jgi:hypothetical protein